MADTTNSLGWEVQKLTSMGWRNASPVVENPGLAELMLEEMPKEQDTEYRVYEALVFPIRSGEIK